MDSSTDSSNSQIVKHEHVHKHEHTVRHEHGPNCLLHPNSKHPCNSMVCSMAMTALVVIVITLLAEVFHVLTKHM